MSTLPTEWPPSLLPMVSKLKPWRLDEEDQAAILGLPHAAKRLGAGQYIVHDGEKPTHSCLLLRGFAYRHKFTGEGRAANHVHPHERRRG